MIFVSIASYKDPDLLNTIESIMTNAEAPDQLRIVVLNQTLDRQDSVYPNVEMFYIDPLKSRGVCWARAIIQSMIRDEDYYLQIDAHMRFAKGWDTKMIKYLQLANSQKPVLTYYPPGFDGDWMGNYVVKNIVRGVGSGAVSSINEILSPDLVTLYNGEGYPLRSHTSAAGFLFAPMKFVHEVPIDPKLFWNYEETDITLRGFTHGWDFFASPEPIIWHKYNTTGKMIHMEESTVWVQLENESNDHAPKKYFDPTYQYPEKYKLGTQRSVKEYEILYNINLATKETHGEYKKDMLVVVPYRDRDEHLAAYMANVPSYFKDISCDFLLCELDPGCEWNAGLTCNSLINFMIHRQYKHIYISHVDVYPLTGWQWPNEGEFITDLGDVGSCLLRTEDFLKVGGYGNNFWGWGGEDDNLYMKLWSKGLTRIKSSSTYHTEFQDHPRPFNGTNYANNLREINKPHDYTEIFKTNKVGLTYDLTQISGNIYKQRVRYTKDRPTKRKVVLGFIWGVRDFNMIAPFVKSTVFYGTDYDVYLIMGDDTPDEHVMKEIKAFGAKVYHYKPKGSNLFIERHNAYQQLLAEYDYEEVIHLDVNDVYLLRNPFEGLNEELILVSEGMTIDNCLWNKNMILAIYGNIHMDKEIICTGFIYGKRDAFIEMTKIFISEYEKFNGTLPSQGADQPILNKLVYSGELNATIYGPNKGLAVHLHHYLNSGITSGIKRNGLTFITEEGKTVAIIHQYNRDQELYALVLNHFKDFFAVDQVR